MPGAIVHVPLDGALARGDLPLLEARVSALLDAGAATVVDCDVSRLAADAVSVEALARLRRATRRHGCRLRVRGATDELRDLAALMGLTALLRG